MKSTELYPYVTLPKGKVLYAPWDDEVPFYIGDGDILMGSTERKIRGFVVVVSSVHPGYWIVHSTWEQNRVPVDLPRYGEWWYGTSGAAGPFYDHDICRAIYIANSYCGDDWGGCMPGFRYLGTLLPLPGPFASWREVDHSKLPPSVTFYEPGDYDPPPYPPYENWELAYEFDILAYPTVDWLSDQNKDLIYEKLDYARQYLDLPDYKYIGMLRTFLWNCHVRGSLFLAKENKSTPEHFCVIDLPANRWEVDR